MTSTGRWSLKGNSLTIAVDMGGEMGETFKPIRPVQRWTVMLLEVTRDTRVEWLEDTSVNRPPLPLKFQSTQTAST